MSGVLLTTIACLLMLCAVLVALVISQGREASRARARAASAEHRCANQRIRIRHQRQRINSLRAEADLLGAACDRLTRRNEALRDDLDALTSDPTLTEALYADLASIDITYPGDPR